MSPLGRAEEHDPKERAAWAHRQVRTAEAVVQTYARCLSEQARRAPQAWRARVRTDVCASVGLALPSPAS